jgi:VanZ family protein
MSKFIRYHLPTILWALAMIMGSVPGQDKVFHFIEYAGLGFLSLRSLEALGIGLTRTAILRLGGAAALFAFLDELHQYPIPGRDASAFDFLSDTAGIAVGITLYWLIRRRQTRIVLSEERNQ